MVIQQVNGTRNQQLDLVHFSLPKLRLGFKGDSDELHPMAIQMLPVTTGPSAGLAASALVIRPRQFLSWTELDRVIPGTNAIFSLSVVEHSEANVGFDDFSSSSVVSSSPPRHHHTNDNNNNTSTSTSNRKCRTIALWKVVQEDVGIVIKGSAKCEVYRFEWSEEMLATAITRMRFYVSEDELAAKTVRESNLSESDRLDSVEIW